MGNKVKRGILLLSMLFLCGNLMIVNANVSSGSRNSELWVMKIGQNKNVLKAGNKYLIKLKIKSNLKLYKVQVEYGGTGFKTYNIRFKAVDKGRTKWKGSMFIESEMPRGIWGIQNIFISAKTHTGKNVKYKIRNNRWATEQFGMIDSIDQNLSAGNIRIRK